MSVGRSFGAGGRRPGRAGPLVALVGLGLATWFSPLVAQEDPDPERAAAIARADAIRDTLTQPPGEPAFDAIDVLGLPLRIVAVPLDLLFRGIGWVAGRFAAPGPPTLPQRVLAAVEEWGVSPRITSFGQRSGVAAELRLVRFEPFFFQTGVSIRGSQRHRLGLAWGEDDDGVEIAYGFLRDAAPRFWGIGSDTPAEARSVYLHDRQEVAVGGRAASGVASFEGGLGYEDHRVDRGFGSEPDIQDVFDPLPFGASGRTRFARFGLEAGLDLTRLTGFQRRGARILGTVTVFRGVDGTPSDFHRLEAEAVGYLPLNPRQQLAARTFIELNRLDDGVGIPFFHLARAGGGTALRGFSSNRFRDRDALGLMLEWRYEIWRDLHQRSRMEFFLFFDEGGVTRSIADVSGRDIHESYGLGFRFVDLEGLVGYTSLGFGGEGLHWRLGDSWSF